MGPVWFLRPCLCYSRPYMFSSPDASYVPRRNLHTAYIVINIAEPYPKAKEKELRKKKRKPARVLLLLFLLRFQRHCRLSVDASVNSNEPIRLVAHRYRSATNSTLPHLYIFHTMTSSRGLLLLLPPNAPIFSSLSPVAILFREQRIFYICDSHFEMGGRNIFISPPHSHSLSFYPAFFYDFALTWDMEARNVNVLSLTAWPSNALTEWAHLIFYYSLIYEFFFSLSLSLLGRRGIFTTRQSNRNTF